MANMLKKKQSLLSVVLVFVLLGSVFLTIPAAASASPITSIPTGVSERVLPASMAGDTSDWIEIARNGDYSLIVRKNYLNIRADHYGELPFQYCPYSSPLSDNYLSSGCYVRNGINDWFNGRAGGTADNLAANARLRSYTVQSNAVSVIGTGSTTASLTNGFSQPSTVAMSTGNDVAFALSFGEAATFLSKYYFVRSALTQSSNAIAATNYDKITIPQVNLYCYGMWLRSPGDISNTASAIDYIGRVFQMRVDPAGNSERGLVYPALWVNSNIFTQSTTTSYIVHYYKAGTAESVIPDKVVTGQVVGSSVTEYAVSVSGYSANPTFIQKDLTAGVNEFIFYYTLCPPITVPYTVHYYEQGTTNRVAGDKYGSGLLNAYVTESAIGVSGYSAVAPTSVTKILGASGNEFIFYYTACGGGSISIAKTVNGIAFNTWLTSYAGTRDELVTGMFFFLFPIYADGSFGPNIATGSINSAGQIEFSVSGLAAGRYAVFETLTGRAADVFAPVTGPLYVYINAAGVVTEDFDYNAFYYVQAPWFTDRGRVTLSGVPIEPYNMIEVWDIEARTSLGSSYKKYTSFCGSGTSKAFGGSTGYVVGSLDVQTRANILAALNYINTKYGSISSWQGTDLSSPITVGGSTRVLSQIVIWTLLHNNDPVVRTLSVTQTGYNTAVFDDAVKDVLSNYAGSVGAVKDIVYLVGPYFPYDTETCQPQIVPLFAPAFNNIVC